MSSPKRPEQTGLGPTKRPIQCVERQNRDTGHSPQPQPRLIKSESMCALPQAPNSVHMAALILRLIHKRSSASCMWHMIEMFRF